MNIDYQEIYISMDDSGVLHNNELYCVYGGIVFTDKRKKDIFSRKYQNIISKFKCCYCRKNKGNCNCRCPEIKDTNIYPKHKRWIFNLIKKEHCFAVIIRNHMVKKDIMDDNSSRGRYRDYAQRLIIKNVINSLIKKNIIDPNKPIKLIIRIDQQSTATDTNREFVNDIKKELTEGFYNYRYDVFHKPIIFSKLEVDLKYVLSHKNTLIQASDLIAGETRKKVIANINNDSLLDSLNYLDTILFLP